MSFLWFPVLDLYPEEGFLLAFICQVGFALELSRPNLVEIFLLIVKEFMQQRVMLKTNIIHLRKLQSTISQVLTGQI